MKEKYGFSLFVFIVIVVIAVLIILVGKMVFFYLRDSLLEKEKLGITTFMNGYAQTLQEYIDEQGNDPNFEISQLDHQKLENVIEIADWYKNKYIVLNGKIVGLKEKMTDKEKEWLKDRIQIQE